MMKNNNRRNYVSNLSQIVMDMEEGKAKYDQTMKELLVGQTGSGLDFKAFCAGIPGL